MLAETRATSLGPPFRVSKGSLLPVGSGFSPARRNPVDQVVRAHNGIDLLMPEGTPVYAMADGVVTRITRWTPDRYASRAEAMKGQPNGNGVWVDHGELRGIGRVETASIHFATVAPGLARGTAVRRGDLLGTVGSTGRSTGPHLHLQLKRDGVPVDPVPVVDWSPWRLVDRHGVALATRGPLV